MSTPSVHLDEIGALAAVNLVESGLTRSSAHAALQVANFSLVLEALVLHNEVTIFSGATTALADSFRSSSLFGPFLDAGVLQIFEWQEAALSPGAHSVPTESFIIPHAAGDWLREEIVLAQAQMHLAATLDATLLPAVTPAFYYAAMHLKSGLARQDDNDSWLRMYAVARAVVEDAPTQDPILRDYEALRKECQERLIQLKSMGASLPIVLPPITSIVLDQAARRDALGSVALRLRDELSPHREAIQTLYSAIGDPDTSVADWERHAGKLQRGMAEVTKDRGVEGVVGVTSAKGVVDFAKEASKGTMGALAAGVKLLAAAPVGNYLRRKDVMFFSFIEERFSRIRGYQVLLDRHFGGSVRKHDIDTAGAFLTSARNVLIDADRY